MSIQQRACPFLRWEWRAHFICEGTDLETEYRANVEPPVCGIDEVVVREEGEARRSSDAGRIAVGASVTDQHVLHADAQCEELCGAEFT